MFVAAAALGALGLTAALALSAASKIFAVETDPRVEFVEDALAGARDIIAEWISEEAQTRAKLRKLFAQEAVITSSVVKKKEESGSKFRDYFDWQEPAAKVPSHRLLAMFRGENEKVLSLTLRPSGR